MAAQEARGPIRARFEYGSRADEAVVSHLQIEPDLAALLQRTAEINHRVENTPDLTFRALLVALLADPGGWGDWFRRLVEVKEVRTAAILAEREVSSEDLEKLRLAPLSLDLAPTWRTSVSANSLLLAAVKYRDSSDTTEAATLAIPHVIAALIYQPHEPKRQLEGWGFDRANWSQEFINRVARIVPAQTETYRQAHAQTFPSNPIGLLDSEGFSAHIATDISTVDDALGYRDYAYAIYRFMTHPLTSPPLTVGIQAPWGGGKTSLMRMLRGFLDPDAEKRPAPRSMLAEARLRLADVRLLLGRLAEPGPATELPRQPGAPQRQPLTVWFNAWKYESTNQLWAGLADAIITQVAQRLEPAERERFWLLLHLHRVDVEMIHRKIYERLLRGWWRVARWFVVTSVGSLAVALAGLGFQDSTMAARLFGAFGWSGFGLSVVATFVAKLYTDKKAGKEPAALSLGEFLRIPDYSKELGFVHLVENDIRGALASIPLSRQPLVVFIDDLDRCSPTKVAQVVEAVNLFLAGDLPNCMFVLGMDAEMVAAALQATHAELTKSLPKDVAIPVGWRFMDKFIQLPFLIPPPEPADLTRYAQSLLSTTGRRVLAPDATAEVSEVAARVSRTSLEAEVKALAGKYKLDSHATADVRSRIEASVARKEIDEGIELFRDDSPQIQSLLAAAAATFSRNPRELKRFANAFRFQYFLWWAQRAQAGGKGPSLEQLQRFVMFSTKWPEVLRWVRRGEKSQRSGMALLREGGGRLRRLEESVAGTDTLAAWQLNAQKELGLDPAPLWLSDEDLFHFLAEEAGRADGQRLSDAAGKGLW